MHVYQKAEGNKNEEREDSQLIYTDIHIFPLLPLYSLVVVLTQKFNGYKSFSIVPAKADTTCKPRPMESSSHLSSDQKPLRSSATHSSVS